MKFPLALLFGFVVGTVGPAAQPQVINPQGTERAVIDPAFWKSLAHPTLVLPPVDWPLDVVVDGERLLRLASLDPQAAMRTQTTRSFELPARFGGAAVPPSIQFVGYPWDLSLKQLSPVYLTERDTADTLVFWRNFFGPNMVFAFAVFSLLAGLLTFGYWLTSKGKRDNSLLYYSLFAVGFVLSFIHYLLGFDSAPSLVLEKVRVVSTPLWFLAFALYLLHRLGKARVWRTPLILMALVYVPFDLAIVGMASPSAVLLASGPVYGVLVVETLLALIALIGFAVRRRDANSLAMVVFQLLAQASFAFDVGYYLVVGYHPWFLTSPYITMFLLVHQLVLLGRDLRRSQHAAEEKSVALERLNQSLHAEVDRRNLDLNSFVSILSYDLKNMLFGLRQLTEGLASQANPEPAAFGQLAVAAHRTEEVLASLLRLSASRTATLQPERRSLSVSAPWGPAPGGGVRCETRLEADATVLSVEDDGPGVPADQRRHVFSLQKPGVPGAGFTERGFGLALCAELAERLGHRLVLASTDSRARFELILEAPGGLTP